MTDQEREASRAARVDRSRVLGDYYRTMSADYAHYYNVQRWPMFPEGHTTYSQQILLDHIHNHLGRISNDEGGGLTEHHFSDEGCEATLHEVLTNSYRNHFEQIGI